MGVNDITGYVLGVIVIALVCIPLMRMVWEFVQYRKKLRSDEEYNPARKKGWVTTTGKFTGKINEHPTRITKTGLSQQPYKEYEVEYYVNGEAYKKWYKFYPAPEPPYIGGDISVVVAYCERKPWDFEVVEIKW